MKMILRAVVMSLVLFGGTVSAQGKFGHIDMQMLISVMPETQTAQVELKAYADDLQKQLEEMQSEFQVKLQEFQQAETTMSEAVKQAKGGDLQDLQQRIQTFNGQAQQDITAKQNETFKPIVEKANEAIATVAKSNNLIYVFETNTLIYKSTESVDVLPLVKRSLGIQ